MIKKNSIVALYRSLTTAEVAINKLDQSGFDMKKLSVTGRGDYRTAEHKIGYDNVTDRMKAWGEADVFWSWFGGIALGSAFFWIPSLRPLMLAGLLFGWIVKIIGYNISPSPTPGTMQTANEHINRITER